MISVSLVDLVVLLYHIHMGAQLDDVGFEDAERTLNDITRELQKYTKIEKGLLESALWSCNLMDEIGYFWHPEGRSFDSFINKILYKKRYKFDKTYNLLERKPD